MMVMCRSVVRPKYSLARSAAPVNGKLRLESLALIAGGRPDILVRW
jgi:hypothetical protein